ncbi:recombinase family protein [Mesorhizobium sp.]|uniref:recombinase family protein n=1 Tax=Mesorhizobium sp. TaxID=1871066 RepID=UPI0025F74ECA|nr:recombinase family protein [Mesorhizobium sp.]
MLWAADYGQQGFEAGGGQSSDFISRKRWRRQDSERRQGEAVEAFARSTGYEIIESYYDAAVSSADAVTARPGFSAMLERLLSNCVRTILVETASRFARDLIVQDSGYEMLKSRGIELIAGRQSRQFCRQHPDGEPDPSSARRGLGI